MSLLVIFVAISVLITNCVCRNFTDISVTTNVVDDDSNFKNEILLNQPINVTLERITEPMRQVFGETYTNNNKKNKNDGNNYRRTEEDNFKPSPRDFRPSPQLDINFEHNEQPVVPAIGEPRKVPFYLQPTEPNRPTTSWRFPNIERNSPSSSTSVNSFNKKSSIYEDMVTYPSETETSQIRASASHPYNFVSDQYEEGHAYEVRATTENSIYHKPAVPQVKEETYEVQGLGKYGKVSHNVPYNVPHNVPQRGLQYPKEELYELTNYDGYDRPPPAISKTYYDYPHYPPQREYPNYKYLFLKKAVKFLAAIIPIGLLISALSPAVVNVTPINNTMTNTMAEPTVMDTRRRTQKLLEDINNVSNPYDLDKIVQKECEERIICELLVGAQMSEYGIQNVERLFTTFIEQETVLAENMEEIRIIFDAAKKRSCQTIRCDLISHEKASITAVDDGTT